MRIGVVDADLIRRKRHRFPNQMVQSGKFREEEIVL